MEGCVTRPALKKLFMISAIIMALKSMKFYYFDVIPSIPLQIIIISIGIILLQGKRYKDIKNYWLLAVILILNFIFIALNNQAVGNIINFMLIISLCLQDSDLKKQLLTDFVKVLSVILFISFFVYIPWLFGLQILPSRFIEFDGRLFRFDYLCLYTDSVPPRFQGLFLEPGHIGMIISFVLFCRGYDLKSKQTWILLLSLILSFSLAGYILTVLGLILYLLLQGKLSFKTLFITAICFSGLYLWAVKQQDNVFYELIFKRLELDGGTIAGDNRYTPEFESFYKLKMENPRYFILGMQEKFDINAFPKNAGYKVYLIENGLVALIFLFLRYCAILFSRFSYKGCALLILFSLSFLQRPYADWFVMYLLFVCALEGFKKHAEAKVSLNNVNKLVPYIRYE